MVGWLFCSKSKLVMAYVVMAYVVMAYILMAYILMAYIVTAYILMAYIVIAYIVTAYRVMTYRVMAYIGMVYIVMAYTCSASSAHQFSPIIRSSVQAYIVMALPASQRVLISLLLQRRKELEPAAWAITIWATTT
jgi:hypothetical protein